MCHTCRANRFRNDLCRRRNNVRGTFDRLMHAPTGRFGVCLTLSIPVRGCIHPIQPGDNLERDLLLTPEQIEHTLLALMALLGRKPALNWRRQPIATVEDLIGVLQAAPPTNTRVAA